MWSKTSPAPRAGPAMADGHGLQWIRNRRRSALPGHKYRVRLQLRAHHPLAAAYIRRNPPPHNRPTWDLTSVLYAVLPDRDYFDLSPRAELSRLSPMALRALTKTHKASTAT